MGSSCPFKFLFLVISLQEIVGVKHKVILIAGNKYWEDFESDISAFREPWTVHDFCSRGAWIVYAGKNYTGHAQGYKYMNARCQGLLVPYTLNSARRVGDLKDNARPWVSIFSGAYWHGEMETTTASLPNIDFMVNSFVVSNYSSLEFFKNTNFEGESVCVQPTRHFHCLGPPDGVCVVPDWEGFEDLPWDCSLAKSVRVGC